MVQILTRKTDNIFLNKFLITLGVLFLIQIGLFLPIPKINLNSINFKYLGEINQKWVGKFYGNKNLVISLFSLNIFPYIKATLFVQLFINIFPNFSELKIKNFKLGKIGYLIRFLTLLFSVFQASIIVKPLVHLNFFLAFKTSLWLISGSMVMLWFSEIISEYGLGNGISLFFYLQILSSISHFLQFFFFESNNNILLLIPICLFSFISLYGVILIEQGIKKISFVVLNLDYLNKELPLKNLVPNYIPLRFNQAGMVPIVLATVILEIPNYFFHLRINFIFLKIIYWTIYFLLIIYFSFFYSYIIINPINLADQLEKMTIIISGLQPGFQTTFYLKQIIERIILIGSIMLATFSLILNIFELTFDITNPNGISISTYLLISTNILLELIREIDNIYFFNVYRQIDNL